MTLSVDIENYAHRIGRCGRAERLGLCISMVATEREKVWYFKNKSKNPGNGSTKLTIPYGTDGKLKPEDKSKWIVEESGDTIWYDEPDLIEKVEARIGQDMRVMDPDDFAVEGVLESPLPPEQRKKRDTGPQEAPSRRALKRKREDTKTASMTYGAKKNDASQQVVSRYASAIAPTVQAPAAQPAAAVPAAAAAPAPTADAAASADSAPEA